MTEKQKSLGGVNVELGNKAVSLDLTAENTTVTLYLTAKQVERLRSILQRGSARLASFGARSRSRRTPKLMVNVKVGTRQHRIFVPEVIWRA